MQRYYQARRDGQWDRRACEDTLYLECAQKEPDDHVDRQVSEQDRGWILAFLGRSVMVLLHARYLAEKCPESNFRPRVLAGNQ